jgi:hypothetical protein
LHEPVDDLVQRAVAADRDDEFGVDVGRELGQVVRPLRVERLAVEPEPGGSMRERDPAPSGRAVVGRRVDEEDGLNDRR